MPAGDGSDKASCQAAWGLACRLAPVVARSPDRAATTPRPGLARSRKRRSTSKQLVLVEVRFHELHGRRIVAFAHAALAVDLVGPCHLVPVQLYAHPRPI